MFKKILVAIDGSECATLALGKATQLARTLGAQLRLVHVVEEMAYPGGLDPFGGYAGDVIGILRENGEKVLKDGLAAAASAGVAADEVLYDKMGERLAETVAEAAREWKADLIVVGTHGRRGVGRLFLGSGAEQIVRLAPVPVLVVRAEEST